MKNASEERVCNESAALRSAAAGHYQPVVSVRFAVGSYL